jgi:hypothetical protein
LRSRLLPLKLLDLLHEPLPHRILKWVFSEPGHLKPKLTRDALTEQVASEFAALALSLRQRGKEPHTVTNLYNERPAWLDNAHREFDEAVGAAYGWPSDMDDDEILRRLFELNQERASM